MADELLTLGANSGTDVTNKVYEEHTVSGSVVTFSDGADAVPLKKCEITLPASLDGYSSVDVHHTGSNLWDEVTEIGAINVVNGQNVANNNFIRSTNYIPVLPNTTYYKCAPQNYLQLYYGKDKGYLSYGSWNKNTTFTTPQDCYFVRFYVAQEYGTTYNNDIALNYPSTFTEYEPYSGTTHTASLGRTIYGGTADAVNGQGQEAHQEIDLGSLTWVYASASSRFYANLNLVGIYTNFPTNANEVADITCDDYETITFSSLSGDSSLNNKVAGVTTDAPFITIRDTRFSNANDFKNAVTGKKAVIPLATPETFTFEPVPIDSKLGNNTMWSEQGSAEVTYYSEREVINNYNVTATQLTAIADAIREKKGTTNPILFEDFPDEIRTIETGGGGGVKSVEWVYTAGMNGSGSTYNYTAVEAGLYLAVAIRYQNTGCSISLPDGGTTVLTSSLSSNRIQLKVVQVEADQRIQMGIYDSSHSRGGWIFKLNVTPNAIAYSRESDSYGDQSFVNQGTSNTVLSIVCTTGTNKFYKWDKTMECYITSPLTAAAQVRIMYGVDMTMPAIVENGPITGQWILSLAED